MNTIKFVLIGVASVIALIVLAIVVVQFRGHLNSFKTAKSPVVFWDQMFRKGALSFVEPLLFHTGLFKLCVFGSAFYHDWLWYPVVGKKRIRKFNKTEWGKLFRRY